MSRSLGSNNTSILLVITGDVEFLSIIARASLCCDCKVRHALSFDDAVAILSNETILICIYDSDLPEVPWQLALPRLSAIAGHACVLLASRVADEYLWQEVIRCGGYDIVIKSAGEERIARTLRFAWFWSKRPGSRNARAANARGESHQA